ncbi:MAG: hypothetical protein Q9163_001904 [Psora crenata]
MDLKATALLKLIYLEMFGYDMSWASFHVLEVMSSQKYLQKRVGYLAAVQSFRPDTEVLMLATNLLKKDISSSLPYTVSLPLVTLPHIITSSLALSLLSDLLPRLSHSDPNIRKKAVAALYRSALVYPDSLKSAWPKIKDLLLDDKQDNSVTAAVVNVICELGWRRPRDFLSLAPRFFQLLVDGGNNWMAIKIIKLFASLTPVEPRLVKKLLPPLTSLIRTTPAMSLLYECISGVIQGGIFEVSDRAGEGEEIASLCVNKLRGMIIIEGDPNLRYVALLAFNKIAASHPHLVSEQEDVIMGCVDDPDISIRLKALDLSVGMVHRGNLVATVERLLQQLQHTPVPVGVADNGRNSPQGAELAADLDEEDYEGILRHTHELQAGKPALPLEYRATIIRQILGMCSKDTYANISDFEWYINILLQLVKVAPCDAITSNSIIADQDETGQGSKGQDIFSAIGWELRNVAVRVSTVRKEALKAANSIIAESRIAKSLNAGLTGSESILSFAAWVSGEYVRGWANASYTLDALLHPRIESLPSYVICAYLQAIPKVLAYIISDASSGWDIERKTMTSLLIARVVKFLEPLTHYPDLEVQERAVEFLGLMRVGLQSVSKQDHDANYKPLVLTKALPRLFSDFDLNPVAPTAQKKVPIPAELNLDMPINQNLPALLQQAGPNYSNSSRIADFESFYSQRPMQKAVGGTAGEAVSSYNITASSYQQTEDPTVDAETILRKQFERRERNKDDPFYIASGEASSEVSTPFHDILRKSNGEDVDIDAIPIMALDLGNQQSLAERSDEAKQRSQKRRSKRVHVIQDETIDHQDSDDELGFRSRDSALTAGDRKKKSLLEVDSSVLSSFPLEAAEETFEQPRFLQEETQDLEMAKALAEVERLRLHMERASERVQAADGAPAEGTLVKVKEKHKKKTKKSKISKQKKRGDSGDDDSGANEKREKTHKTIIKKSKRRPRKEAAIVEI